jgi:hypothetical protein
MHAYGMRHFKNCHLARMSDGHYCIIRDLGPVKGGKGLKHHEVVVDFTWRALIRFLAIRRSRKALQTLWTEMKPGCLPRAKIETGSRGGVRIRSDGDFWKVRNSH